MIETQILHTKPLVEQLEEQISQAVNTLKNAQVAPHLAVILVGQNPASKVYVQKKKENAEKFGVQFTQINLPETIQQDALHAEIEKLNHDDAITGILVQMPLPAHINAHQVLSHIDVLKDVDGLSPTNSGRVMMDLGEKALLPATPLGIMRILDWVKFPLKGAEAVMVGRSHLVGRPTADLLGAQEATVAVCHKETRDLSRYTKTADLIVVATGVPALIKGENIKNGAVIIDVGISEVDADTTTGKRKIVGDVDASSCKGIASMLTPVPGGVGPMTVISLMTNIVDACQLQSGKAKVNWQIKARG